MSKKCKYTKIFNKVKQKRENAKFDCNNILHWDANTHKLNRIIIFKCKIFLKRQKTICNLFLFTHSVKHNL